MAARRQAPGERDPADYVEAVLALVEQIPPGRVMSYGAIAEYLYPAFGQASPRRVGTIMAQYGGTVPWHRVVTGGGRMPPGHEQKAQRLLEADGGATPSPAPASAWPPTAGTPPPDLARRSPERRRRPRAHPAPTWCSTRRCRRRRSRQSLRPLRAGRRRQGRAQA